MRSYRSSALIASAALALGAAAVPASAFADDTASPTSITTADLVSALTADKASTAAAGKIGWIATGTFAEGGSAPAAVKAIYAVQRGAMSIGGTTDIGVIEAQHSGTYMTLSTIGYGHGHGRGPRIKAALKAIKKPAATWFFLPDASLDLHNPDGNSGIAQIAPDNMLQQLIDPKQTTLTGTPTETVAIDGSTTYAFSEKDLTSDGESGTGTVTVDAHGVLTAFTVVGASGTGSLTYSYGPQQVALPSAASTVTFQQLNEGTFLATLPHSVKSEATQVARLATRAAHKHAVKVSAIRGNARMEASLTNSMTGAKVESITPIPGGVRITGTNRYNHTHVSYTVKASGTKAVVRKA